MIDIEAFHLNNDACGLIRRERSQCSIVLLHKALTVLCVSQNVKNRQRAADPCHPLYSYSHESRMDQNEDETSLHHFSDNEHDEGMGTFSQPLIISSREYLGEDRHYRLAAEATILFNLGIANNRIGEDNAALECFKKTFDIQESIWCNNNATGPSLHAILHNIGHLHWKAGRNANAVTSYQKALDLLPYNDCHRSEISCTLNCIAMVRCHDVNNATEEILSILNRALELRSNPNPTNDRVTSIILRNKGRVNFARKEYTEALRAFKEAHRQQVVVLGSSHIDAAVTLFHIARVNENLGHIAEAIDVWREFVSIVILNGGERRHDVVGTYLHIGKLFLRISNMDQAHCFFSWALRCAKLVFGPHDSSVAKILNLIGNVLIDQGKHDLALEAYQSGLAIEQINSHSGLDENIAISLLSIAQTYIGQKRLDKALEVYIEVLDIKRRSNDEGIVITILSYMGLIYQMKGMLDLAIDMFEEAVIMLRRLECADNNQLSSSLNALGIVHFKNNSFAKALAKFLEAIEIRQSYENEDIRETIGMFHNLASVYKSIGQPLEAMEVYRHILCLEQQTQQQQGDNEVSNSITHKQIDNHENIALLHGEIGLLLQAQGDLDGAIRSLEVASNICLEHPTEISRASAYNLFSSLGSLHIQMGDVDTAVETYSLAREVYDVVSDVNLGQGTGSIRMNTLDWQMKISKMAPVVAAAAA